MGSARLDETYHPASETAEAPTRPSDRIGQTLLKVVVVGQVPPPVNGQSLMIREFLNGSYSDMELIHVPMAFSRLTSEIGSFRFRKLAHLVRVLSAIAIARLRTGATILYYPPADANLVPVLRDLVLLIPTRWLFRRTVFHFHAAGLYAIYPRLPKLLRLFFHLAYDRPDLAIFTTTATSAESVHLRARSTVIIPCGVPDHSFSLNDEPESPSSSSPAVPTILYAGIICEAKGILVLLEACRILRQAGTPFRLVCMGSFLPSAFENEVENIVRSNNLESNVDFVGTLTGREKHHAFATANIFCFPSHYPAESFGVVLIEAMSYGLPIVATEWRGIPEVTGDDGGACLVPIQDPVALAAMLHTLLVSPLRRESMGHSNRKRYLAKFTLENYRNSLEHHLHLANGTTPG
jgi:glycosyltransferase involved in cell wall biosynthesis